MENIQTHIGSMPSHVDKQYRGADLFYLCLEPDKVLEQTAVSTCRMRNAP